MQIHRLQLPCVWILVAFAGCTTTHSGADRNFETGIAPSEKIAIVLEQHKDCNADEECKLTPEPDDKEQSYAACVARGLRSVNTAFVLVSAGDFRRAAFPDSDSMQVPRTHQALLEAGKDAGFRASVTRISLRYLVVLDTQTSLGSGNLIFEGNEIAIIGSHWVRHSVLYANVIDLREGRLAGTLNSYSQGKSGFVVPLFFLIPLLPIPFSAPTETEACYNLGVTLAKFLLQIED